MVLDLVEKRLLMKGIVGIDFRMGERRIELFGPRVRRWRAEVE